jgi:MFS family permease
MSESDAFSGDELLAERFCIGCGYNLRGIDSDRCPECGTVVDRSALATSVIPWSHRRTLGIASAYLRTVKLSILHPAKLAQEIGRPASFPDAILFRRITAGLATVSIIALIICLVCVNFTFGDLSGDHFEIVGVVVFWICVWFFFLTSGGVASYWFAPSSRPIEQQNRAIAISYYASGPLGLTPIPITLIIAAILLGFLENQSFPQWSLGWFDAIFVIGISGVGLLVCEFVLMQMSATRLLRHSTHCSAARSVCCWMGLPIAWAILAVIFLVALPAAYIFIALMILSFR